MLLYRASIGLRTILASQHRLIGRHNSVLSRTTNTVNITKVNYSVSGFEGGNAGQRYERPETRNGETEVGRMGSAVQVSSDADELIVDPLLPTGEPKRMGKILLDTYDLLKRRTIEQSLKFVDEHEDLLLHDHVHRLFGNIHRELKTLNFDPDIVTEMRQDPRFHKLYILAGKKCRYFAPSQVAYMIKFLVKLGYDSDTVLMRMLLVLATHHVNDLNVSQLSYLGHYLLKMTRTNQIDLLLRALAMAVENRLANEARFLDTHTYINLLEAFGGVLSEESRNFVLESLFLHKDSKKFNKPDVIVKALGEYGLVDSGLIRVCVDLSIEFMRRDEFSPDQALDLLSGLAHFQWYDPTLFSETAKYLDRNEISCQEKLKFLDKILRCDYAPTVLIHSTFEQILKADLNDFTYDDKELITEIIHELDGVIDLEFKLLVDKIGPIEKDDKLNSGNLATEDFDIIKNYFGLVSEVTDNEITDFDFAPRSAFSVKSAEKDVQVFIFSKGDFFQNLGKLKGSKHGPFQRFLSENSGPVLVLSYWKFKRTFDHEKIGIIRLKLSEAERDGLSLFL